MFGLILLAREVRDQRVLSGEFGCANCRERYPVVGGFGDFRPAPAPPLATEFDAEDPGSDDPEGALRIAALLGVERGPGFLLLAGAPARQAERVAGMVEGIEVVALHAGLRGREEASGVSRCYAGERWPFFSALFRGSALGAQVAQTHLDEALRVTAPGGRLVVELPESEVSGGEGASILQRLRAQTRELLLEAEGLVVAVR
jgi:hypothetical protein